MHVNGVQSHLDGTEEHHGEALLKWHMPAIIRNCQTLKSEIKQEPLLFPSVKVKCEVEVSCFLACLCLYDCKVLL